VKGRNISFSLRGREAAACYETASGGQGEVHPLECGGSTPLWIFGARYSKNPKRRRAAALQKAKVPRAEFRLAKPAASEYFTIRSRQEAANAIDLDSPGTPLFCKVIALLPHRLDPNARMHE
jgi:hypothetical protein